MHFGDFSGKDIGKSDNLWLIYNLKNMLKCNQHFFKLSGSEGEDFDESWDYSISLFFPSYYRNGWVKFILSYCLRKKNQKNLQTEKTQTPKHVMNLSSSQPI